MDVSVTYAQSLSGQRWKLYSPWTKFMPGGVLDELGHRLPVRRIWQGDVSCGDVDTSLSVMGGHPKAQWTGNLQHNSWYVASGSLNAVRSRADLMRGQLLAVAVVTDLLPAIAQELRVYPHQLSVGLAVRDAIAKHWVAGLEYAVRSITLIGAPRHRNLPLSHSGLAVRQLQTGAIALDVDVLIVAPEYLSWAADLSLRRRTAVIVTDGSACAEFVGCSLITFNLSQPDKLPSELLAGPDDLLPLNETIVLASYLASSGSNWSVRVPQQLSLIRRAVAWSEWDWRWKLADVMDEGKMATRMSAEIRGLLSQNVFDKKRNDSL